MKLKHKSSTQHEILACERTRKEAPSYDQGFLKLRQGQTLYCLNSVEAGGYCVEAIERGYSAERLAANLLSLVDTNLVIDRATATYSRKYTMEEKPRSKNVSWEELRYFSANVKLQHFSRSYRGSRRPYYDTEQYSEGSGLTIRRGDWVTSKLSQHIYTTSKKAMLRRIKQLAENPYTYAANYKEHMAVCSAMDDFWQEDAWDSQDDDTDVQL